jgi:hypothetical protein
VSLLKANTEHDVAFGCDLWTGATGNNGRPIVWRGKSPIAAYRIAYIEAHGEIPEDRAIDHVCRRVLCVNPEHLEAVTKSENERRKSMRYRLQRKQCSRGHRLDEVTRLLTPEGGVLCRLCARAGVHQGLPPGQRTR